jgi:hypothetical protein
VRWPPQCSCIVIESSFDPGERLQAPVNLCFFLNVDSMVASNIETMYGDATPCQRAGPPNTILEEDHPMTILSKFGSNCATGSRQEDFLLNKNKILMKYSLDGSLPKMCPAVRPFDQDGPHSRT